MLSRMFDRRRSGYEALVTPYNCLAAPYPKRSDCFGATTSAGHANLQDRRTRHGVHESGYPARVRRWTPITDFPEVCLVSLPMADITGAEVRPKGDHNFCREGSG